MYFAFVRNVLVSSRNFIITAELSVRTKKKQFFNFERICCEICQNVGGILANTPEIVDNGVR